MNVISRTCSLYRFKYAVIGLAKTPAFEYGKQGIRVNAICPGATETRLLDGLAGGDSETLKYADKVTPHMSPLRKSL